MKIEEVQSKKQERSFLDLPASIYQSDNAYVRPLNSELKKTFSHRHNSFFDHGTAKRWLLIHREQVIGRIAAFIDFRKIQDVDVPAGGIGFFECISDQSAANQLFETARKWLSEHEMMAMEGPINFGENNNYWGLLVEGFTQPAYGMNYNPPYYQQLFENYGFARIYQQFTNHLDITRPLPTRFRNIVDRVLSNGHYDFRKIEVSNLDRFISDFTTIYNDAWAHHENFQCLTESYVRYSFEQMRAVLVPEMIWFAYVDGAPAGFIVAMPDLNQILTKLNGKMNIFSQLKFLWHKRKGTIDRVRVIIMGIRPAYRKKGIESGLIVKAFDAVKKLQRYREAELSWVGDFNPEMMAIHKASGATFGKKHITYRKVF